MRFDKEEIDNVFQFQVWKSLQSGYSIKQAKAVAKLVVRRYKREQYAQNQYYYCSHCNRKYSSVCKVACCPRCKSELQIKDLSRPEIKIDELANCNDNPETSVIEKYTVYQFLDILKRRQHESRTRSLQYNIIQELLNYKTITQISQLYGVTRQYIYRILKQLRPIWKLVNQ